MLRNKTKFIAMFAILILLFLAPFAFADDENQPVTTSEGQTENTAPPENEGAENQATETNNSEQNFKKGDVYLTGNNITVDYIIDGNLFVISSGEVTINSQIAGDAFVMANKVTIGEQGYIFSNLFTCAPTVEIKGVVYDAYLLSQKVTISGGYIYRDLKASCQTLNVWGTVGRNAYVNTNTISFTDEAVQGMINGDLNYSAKSELSIPEGSVVGNTNYSAAKGTEGTTIQSYLLNLGGLLVLIIIIWLLGLWLTPKLMESTNEMIKTRKLPIILSGLLGLIVTPIVAILLLILGITAPVGMLLLVVYFLILAISKPAFIIVLNRFICSQLKIDKPMGIFGMLIVTGIVLWAIGLIPYVGPIVSMITVVLGLGTLLTPIITKNAKKDMAQIAKEKEEKRNQKKLAKENKKSNEKTNENK